MTAGLRRASPLGASARPWRALARGAAAGLAMLGLASCYPASPLDPAGPVAASDGLILIDALVIMLAVGIPVTIATLAFAWWFRASNPRARRLPNWAYSGRVELVIWSIPILVIMFLGGLAWIGSHELDPSIPVPGTGPTLNVQVVALDWKWLFIYPEQGVASVNRLVIPVGAPIRMQLTSGSVMTAFFIPQLGSMIYVMNGMVSPLNLRADRPGVYFGEASHFSGDGFADMNFATDAVSPADFARWAQGVRAAGPVLDAAAYEALSRQSADLKPFTYRAVQPGLFADIALQRLPPGPGPQGGHAGGASRQVRPA